MFISNHNNLNPPVTPSTTPLGPGPTPNTVTLPLTTCVLPASLMTSAQSPTLTALARSSKSCSSSGTCRAILGWPEDSQRLSKGWGDEGDDEGDGDEGEEERRDL